jgi:hypothetical protein
MSRIRTVKPEFWSNEQVMNCSTNARLMFIGLWNFVDDAGRHTLACKQIKALIFPGDDFSSEIVRGWFDELSANGLIQTYIIDDKEYFQVTGWHHQKIDRPQPSKLPAPPVDVVEHSSNDRAGREGKGEEGKGKKDPPSGRADVSHPPATNGADPDGSDEDIFWHLAGEIKAKGIARSQCGQLAKALNGDFERGISILRDVAQAKGTRGAYLAKIVRNIEQEGKEPRPPPDASVPEWVSDARSQGYPVTKEGRLWRMSGVLWDDNFEQVGA